MQAHVGYDLARSEDPILLRSMVDGERLITEYRSQVHGHQEPSDDGFVCCIRINRLIEREVNGIGIQSDVDR